MTEVTSTMIVEYFMYGAGDVKVGVQSPRHRCCNFKAGLLI